MTRPEYRLVIEATPEGHFPVLSSGRGSDFVIRWPLHFTFMEALNPYKVRCGLYNKVEERGGEVVAVGEVTDPDGLAVEVRDRWSFPAKGEPGTSWVALDRVVTVRSAGKAEGIRCDLLVESSFEGGVDARGCEYLVPCAFYRHLDMDNDGVPDNYQSYNVAWAEDKLAFPGAMGFFPEAGVFFAIARRDLAEHDSSALQQIFRGDRFFLLDTDIGSVGFKPHESASCKQVVFRAHYPFFEGDVSYGITRKGYPWGVFKPCKAGQSFDVSYYLAAGPAEGYAKACWGFVKSLITIYDPKVVALPYTLEEANRNRLDLLNKFFYSWDASSDPREPAGYIINMHPLEGKTLGHVIEYGFSGKQLMNAYVCMRHAYEAGDQASIEKARRVIDFFDKHVVQANGFCHGVYSADEKCFVPWFSGILLPYSFALTKQEQVRYLGKDTCEGLEVMTAELKRVSGAFTRPMAEEGYSLLTCYELENEHGNDHPEWLETARRIGEFFLRIQNEDGSWYRAVDPEGEPVTVPEGWFGRTEDMRKSTTYVTVTFMLKLFQVTKDARFLDAAVRGGDFTIDRYVKTSYMYGTLLDHPFNGAMKATGPIMDNVSPMFAMEALLYLHEVTGQQRFLEAAVTAAQISATWINLWDVPWPKGTTLSGYGFRSTGWSPVNAYACSFQTDLYPLYFVRDFLKISSLTGDPCYARLGELMQYAMNEMVSTPKETYGYAHYGLQNEGRVMSWFLTKEWAVPTAGTQDSFEFAGRGKGEENKTAYGWMYAIPLGGYYRVLDEYGTADFGEIRARIEGRR